MAGSGWTHAETSGLLSVCDKSTIQEALSVCIYIASLPLQALSASVLALCSCIVFLHLLLLFELTPISFFFTTILCTHSAALQPQKQYIYDESLFVRGDYQAVTCSSSCCDMSTINYDVSNHANNLIPFCTQN